MEKAQEYFGHNVRHHRKKMGLTQVQLAVEVGCSLPTVQRIETGLQFPRSDMIEALSKALNISEVELFKDPMFSANTISVSPTPKDFAKAVADEIIALNAPTAPKLDTEKDRLIFAITSQLAAMDENKLRTIRSFVNDMLHIDTAAIKVKRTK